MLGMPMPHTRMCKRTDAKRVLYQVVHVWLMDLSKIINLQGTVVVIRKGSMRGQIRVIR